MTISKEYRDTLQRMHKERGTFGTSGKKYVRPVEKLIHRFSGQFNFSPSVLDYGCGKGTLRQRLTHPVTEYDPAIPGKDELPLSRFDIVVCTDVLEHVEPEHLEEVLAELQYLTQWRVFFVISTREAQKTLPDGRNAHLIVQPYKWWMERIGRLFHVHSTSFDGTERDVTIIASPLKGDNS